MISIADEGWPIFAFYKKSVFTNGLKGIERWPNQPFPDMIKFIDIYGVVGWET